MSLSVILSASRSVRRAGSAAGGAADRLPNRLLGEVNIVVMPHFHRKNVVATRRRAGPSSPPNRTDGDVLNADTSVNRSALPNLFSESLPVFVPPIGWLIGK